MIAKLLRPALLLAAPLALCFLLAGCDTTPATMTVHGTVTLTSLNGVPPLQAYGGYGTPGDINPQVNIVADDGPGNYAGKPWNQAVTDMTLKSATAKVITFTFTAQVPGDAVLYQISAVCCTESLTGQDFTFEEMQAGPALCFGDGCPAG
jgi:hypothetical protein